MKDSVCVAVSDIPAQEPAVPWLAEELSYAIVAAGEPWPHGSLGTRQQVYTITEGRRGRCVSGVTRLKSGRSARI